MSGRREKKKKRMQTDDATYFNMILRSTLRHGRIGIVAGLTFDAVR